MPVDLERSQISGYLLRTAEILTGDRDRQEEMSRLIPASSIVNIYSDLRRSLRQRGYPSILIYEHPVRVV